LRLISISPNVRNVPTPLWIAGRRHSAYAENNIGSKRKNITEIETK